MKHSVVSRNRGPLGLAVVAAGLLLAVACSEYGFYPRAVISTDPNFLRIEDQTQEKTVSVRVRNAAPVAVLKVFEMWIEDDDPVTPHNISHQCVPVSMVDEPGPAVDGDTGADGDSATDGDTALMIQAAGGCPAGQVPNPYYKKYGGDDIQFRFEFENFRVVLPQSGSDGDVAADGDLAADGDTALDGDQMLETYALIDDDLDTIHDNDFNSYASLRPVNRATEEWPGEFRFDLTYVPEFEVGSDVLQPERIVYLVIKSSDPANNFRKRVKIVLEADLGQAPVPKLTWTCQSCEDPTRPQPLEKVTFDARDSFSPYGAEREPLSFWWEWEQKPPRSEDAVLTCRTCDYQNPRDITRQWTPEAQAKLYFAVSGTYVIKLKVRDALGLESLENRDPEKQWARVVFDVKPSQKVHVQLVWDQGFNTDLDLHLTRQRDQGTFHISSSLYDHPSGVLEACTTDADCDDPGVGLNCNPTKPATQTAPEKICTFHTWAQQNDDCFFRNRQPDWGTAGEPGDDPTLDIDDTNGYGPENISIRRPPDGTFRVTVRWYTGPLCTGCTADVCDCRTAGTCTEAELEKCEWCQNCAAIKDLPVTAYLTIYIKGEKAGEFSQQLTRNNMYWKVADIIWSGGEEGDGVVTAVPVGSICDTPPCPPEANPFFTTLPTMDPTDPDTDNPASIWCDSAGDPDCP